MADEKNIKMELEVDAVANKKSAEQAVSELANSVEKASKKSRIEVPVNINTLIDKKDTESKLSKAQLDVVKSINKMSKKGFSASAKDIDTLNGKMTEFSHQMDQAGKGRQNKIFREIRKQVDELNKSFKAFKTETKSVKINNTKAKNTKKPTITKKTAEDRYLDKQEQYSQRAKGAGKRTELKKELDYVRENKSLTKSSGDIKASRTNDHLMRLSEYSAYGSNWANDLAKILKEEVAEAAKTLVTYIEPNYKIGTRTGKEKNPIEQGNKFPETDEKTFLSNTIKNIKKQLRNAIIQSEAGEDITLDSLKEKVAVIKVLNKQLGKTAEDTEKLITNAIEKPYTQSELKKIGGTNLEEGQQQGVGLNHENTQKLKNDLYTSMKVWDDEVKADTIAKEIALGTDKVIKENKKKAKNVQISQADKKVSKVELSDDFKTEMTKLNAATNQTHAEIRNGTKATQDTTKAVSNNTAYTKVEGASERVADTKTQNINQDVADTVEEDSSTGFNTDTTAKTVISILQQIFKVVSDILNKIEGNISTKLALPEPKLNSELSNGELWKKLQTSMNKGDITYDQAHKIMADKINANKQKVSVNNIPGGPSDNNPLQLSGGEQPKEPYTNKVQKSNIYATSIKQSLFDKLSKAFDDITGRTKKFGDALDATAEEQDKLAAERIITYGLTRGRNPTDTGDIANITRSLELFRSYKAGIYANSELKQNVKLTPGLNVDTTKLFEKISKTVLSPKEMRKAQMGGGYLRNIIGAGTAFIGMPSREKTRSQAEIVNQVMANVRDAMQQVLDKITAKETELSGLEQSGKVKFDNEGNMIYGTSAAKKTLADLEEMKLVFASMIADVEHINEGIDKGWGNSIKKFIKNFSFTSPMLVKQNDLIRNGRAGLDKNGKALKFQKRTAEILNYTFQLIGRSIGQWLKKVLSMINPINIIKSSINQIKKLFSDFTSYDTKWQRTMNVIKYNLRSILKPFMEWIAQKIVNIIGFIDIISVKIQQAFGYAGISLFDQAAADAEKIAEEMQEAANTTLGFDELHDIGTDNSGANDLLGDIYTPQLSQKWIDLANEIGDLFAGLITGDLGFGDVAKRILEILGDLLSNIGTAIWDWFKETALGKYITEHWKGILATVLGAFLAWKLLKIGASTLFTSLFGGLSTKAVSLFSALGTKLGSVFGTTIAAKLGSATLTTTVGKLLGGGIASVASAVLSITLAKNTARDWQDSSAWQKAGGVAGTAIFAGLSGVFASLALGLGALSPVTWIVATGVALTSLVVALSTTQDGIKSVKKETKEWEAAQEALNEALDIQEEAQQNYRDSLVTLKELEEETGYSGEALADAISSGALTVDDMNSAQLRVYNAYIQATEALKDQTEAQKAANEAAQTEAKEYSDTLIAQCKKGKTSWEEFADYINEAWESGTMSTETATDQISRAMANMSETARTELLENLQPALQEGLDYEQYQSGWTKFGNFWKELWADLVGAHDDSIADMQATEESLIETTDALKEAQNNLLESQNRLSEAEQNAGMTWDELNEKLRSGEISIMDLTDAQRELYDAHIEVSNSSALVDQAMEKTGEQIVGLAQQTYQASGDWKTYINTLINANQQGTLSTEDMKEEIGIALADMNSTTRSEAEDYLESIDMMTDGVEQAEKDHESLFSRWGKSIKSFVSDAGKKLSEWWNNLFGSGKKTAEIDVTTNTNGTTTTTNVATASFAVGTNYVPNDGLAYLHQGEAVIPKKYNQPYQASGLSQEERNYMERMVATINRLDSTISQGITVNGEFRQKGSDLVATVNKVNNRQSNTILNNKVYAR